MSNENHEIIETIEKQQKIDLKIEAKKQINAAASGCLKSCEEPAKEFTNKVIEYCINRLLNWVDEKLSA